MNWLVNKLNNKYFLKFWSSSFCHDGVNWRFFKNSFPLSFRLLVTIKNEIFRQEIAAVSVGFRHRISLVDVSNDNYSTEEVIAYTQIIPYIMCFSLKPSPNSLLLSYLFQYRVKVLICIIICSTSHLHLII